MATSRLCSIPDCNKPVKARDLCSAHHSRLLRHGDPLAGGTAWGEPMEFFSQTVLLYKGDECLIWPYGRNAFGVAMMWVDGQMQIVPRLVCEHRHGPAPTHEHEAAHGCGRGRFGCCAQMHLSWKTHGGNMADTIIHGTSLRGSRNPNTKLTEHEVREIRSLKGQMLQREIATLYGVTRTAVGLIHRGIHWNWLV